MRAATMDYQLTLTAIMRRADALYGRQQIVTRLPDRDLHRYSYAEAVERAKRLAVAFGDLGLRPGDRVATLAWNTYQHYEVYLGVPAAGGVVHTLNPRLHPDELAYIATHAEDRALIVDASLLPVLEQFRGRAPFEHVIAVNGAIEGALDYEQLLASADAGRFSYHTPDEWDAASMCYTSGTTGRPKAVVYSHRALALMALCVSTADVMGIRAADTVLPVVPMFHANAWSMPFAASLTGAKQVFPGPHLDPASLVELFEGERVTFTAGVPTIFNGILHYLDENPGVHDLSALREMTIGGSAVPQAMIEGFARHGLTVVHGWGMTEMSPVGTISRTPVDLADADEETRMGFAVRQGRPIPFVEIRARGAEGLVPWDGETLGELEVRGPSVTSEYYRSPGSEDSFTDDGWFRTGDIVTIDERGYMEVADRTKDLIKSGGEWISSVSLENELMNHPAVFEAAVIAVPDVRWSERPLAVCVLRPGRTTTPEELRAHLERSFPRWWVPESFEFVDEIPRTAAGKFKKTTLRDRFASSQRSAVGG